MQPPTASQCTQQITVSDKSAPVIDCNTIQPITAEITNNACRIALNITAPIAKDNCDKDITGTAVLPSTFGLATPPLHGNLLMQPGNEKACTQNNQCQDKSVPVIDCNTIQPITAEITDNNACRIALTLTAPSEGQLRQGHHRYRQFAIYLWSWRYHHYLEVRWMQPPTAPKCTQQITVSDKAAPVIDCSKINPITAEITDNLSHCIEYTAPTAKDNCNKDITGTAILPSTFWSRRHHHYMEVRRWCHNANDLHSINNRVRQICASN